MHRNQHEWVWLPEFGSYFAYCELCKRARGINYETDKEYYSYGKAMSIVAEIIKDHPVDCSCEICGQGGREAHKRYWNWRNTVNKYNQSRRV